MSTLIAVEPGHEIECDRAKLTESAILVRANGVWIELRPEDADKELKIAIARLDLQRGDILVIKSPMFAQPGFRAPDLSYFLPLGVRVMCIAPDVELSVLTKDDIEARVQP
jgi:hypothetical protein